MDKSFREEVREKFKQNDEFQHEMYEFKDETTQKLDALITLLNEVHNIVLVIEHDLHDKTSALFDAYSLNNDEHQIINTRLCDLENLALKNSAKISVLEDTARFTF